MPGTLFVVATPIGNLEDITIRALRVLREVAVIAAEDTRRTAQLLARHAISTPTTSLHEHNETKKSAAILARLERGESVALVSDAGTPAVSDPGARLVGEAIRAGIKVEPIPGPSAVMAAVTASGFSADAFTFMGFPPIKSKDRTDWLSRMRTSGGTVVFFEAPHRIEATLHEILMYLGDRPITVARELTKVHEQLVNGPISQVIQHLGAPRGEYTVVVDVGQSTDPVMTTTDADSNSRRQALAAVARSHGLTANQLYSAIEDAKKSADRPT
jgi:16S rRNA (cytidine1402-2'-O)-methyltransferase